MRPIRIDENMLRAVGDHWHFCHIEWMYMINDMDARVEGREVNPETLAGDGYMRRYAASEMRKAFPNIKVSGRRGRRRIGPTILARDDSWKLVGYPLLMLIHGHWRARLTRDISLVGEPGDYPDIHRDKYGAARLRWAARISERFPRIRAATLLKRRRKTLK